MARGVIEELAYVLRAETEGLAGDLRGAEGHLNKFTAFVERNPLAAAGALGAALLTAGTAATKMALDVERGLHRIERVVPGATGKLGALRESIEALSKESPRTQAALAQAADAIAAGGVESMEALDQRLKASVRAADASGADLGAVISGLDQVLDLFGASSADADTMLMKLFATAKGRFPIDDLLSALQGATPTIREFGIDFDTATRALGALLEQGRTAKQAGSELKAYAALGAEGAAAIRALAESHVIATTAVTDYEAAVEKSRKTLDASWQVTKNNFSAVMIDLGQKILPAVSAEMRGIVGLMDLMSGAATKITSNARVTTMKVGFSTSGRGVSADQFGTQARQLTRDAKAGLLDLTGVTLEDLTRMKDNLDRLRDVTGATRDEFFALYIAIENAMKSAARATATPVEGAAGGAGTGVRVRTPEEIAAEQEREKAAAKARADALKALAREAQQVGQDVARFILGEMGTAVEQAAAPIDDLIARVKALIAAGHEVDENTARLGDLERLRGLTTSAVEARTEVELLMDRIERSSARGEGPTADVFRELATSADILFSHLLRLNPASAEYARIQALLVKLEKERRGLLKDIANANVTGDGEDSGDSNARTAGDYARSIQQAADGALQLAQNLGGADESAIGLLRTIGQIASASVGLADAIDTGSVGGIIGTSLTLLGAATSLFGESPAEKKRNEELARNTEAIRGLTEKAGALGIGISGTEASGAASGLTGFLASVPRVPFFDARKAARAYGLDVGALEELAKAHGVTLNGNIESFYQLQEALGLTITKLGEFDTTLDSQKAQADAEIKIFGITDPFEQFRIRQGAVAGRSPALDGITAGLDLSTPEGRAEARRRAEELFGIMKAGGGALTDSQLGGLNGDELLQALLDLIEGLNSMEAMGGGASAGSSSGTITGFRSLTEATGSRLADYARAELDAVREILALLQRWAMPMLLPPTVTMPALMAGGGGGGSYTLHITVNVNHYGAGDANQTAALVADGARAGAEEALTASGLIREQRLRGDLRIM